MPFVGVLRPTAREAATATRNGRIGVLGTAATIRSGSYQKELAAINPDLQVFAQDCPLFVPLVESGFVQPGDPITRLTVERYLEPMKAAGVDTLILGCTHYPIIAPVISQVMGDGVTLINSGREAARFCTALLAEKGLVAIGTEKPEGPGTSMSATAPRASPPSRASSWERTSREKCLMWTSTGIEPGEPPSISVKVKERKGMYSCRKTI